MSCEIEQRLLDVEAAQTTEDELCCLTQLANYLDATAKSGEILAKCDEDDLEASYLRSAASAASVVTQRDEQRAPSDAAFFGSIRSFDFVVYVFLRRYGWSETIGDATVRRMTCTGRASDNELELKGPMNSVLEKFITWMGAQNIDARSLDTYAKALQKVSDHHLVRKLLLTHVLTWLTRHFEVADPSLFDTLKRLIMSGLGDCWSAVRSACSSKLGRLLDKFSLSQLESFFLDIVAVCKDAGACWQAKDGAAMAVVVVIKRFHRTYELLGNFGSAHDILDSSTKNRVHLLKFGKDQVLSRLPGFISSNIYDVSYRLLRHEQLSIRECAIRALSSYLTCCDFEEAVRTLEDVVQQLRRACGIAEERTVSPWSGELCETANSTASHFRHASCDLAGSTWMNAYAAEGLLGVCTFLVKHIPSQLLLPQWDTYFATFLRMLEHPASTVRQAASVVFKFIVSRGASNPVMLWLVLHGLSNSVHGHSSSENGQLADQGVAVSSCAPTAGAAVHSVPGGSQSQVSAGWELAEGRLLTYELVLHFLNKNHWLYIFDVHEAKAVASALRRSRSSALTASASEVDATSKRIRSLCGGHLNKVHTYSGASFKVSLQSAVEACESQSSSVSKTVIDTLCTSQARKPSCSANFVNATIDNKQNIFATREAAAAAADSNSRRQKAVVGCLDDSGSSSTNLSNLSLAACSLLQAAKVLHHHRRGHSSSSGGGESVLPADSRLPGQLSQTAAADTADHQRFVSSSRSMPRTYDCVSPVEQVLPQRSAFSTIFEAMFLQTAECIGSSKWELRRIGNQVLPCLTETIGWYDDDLLVSLWEKHLVTDDDCSDCTCSPTRDEALRYSTCLSLLYMLRYSAKLRQLLNAGSVPREQTGCKRQEEVERVTKCIDRSLPRLVSHVAAILRRSTIDRLTSAALQIVALSATLFDESTLGNHDYLIADVSAAIIDATMAAHPELLGLLGGGPLWPNDSRRSFASGCFASLCSHDQNQGQAHLAECSERHLLSDVASCLPALIKKFSCINDHLWPLLPILAYHACCTADDLTRRVASDSVSCLATAMTQSLKASFCESKKTAVESMQVATVKVLCRQLQETDVKVLGAHKIRPILDLLATIYLCEDGNCSLHLTMALKCLCDQWLKSGSRVTRVFAKPAAGVSPDQSSVTQLSAAVVSSCDLEIMSNDIPCGISLASTSDDDSSCTNDDEDIGSLPASVDHDAIFGGDLIDATSLSSKNGGHDRSSSIAYDRLASPITTRFASLLGATGDHPTASSSAPHKSCSSSDSSSAWDSCDESDEEMEIGNLFSDCIAKLIGGLVQMGQSASVDQQLTQLTSRQRSLVKTALSDSADAKILRL